MHDVREFLRGVESLEEFMTVRSAHWNLEVERAPLREGGRRRELDPDSRRKRAETRQRQARLDHRGPLCSRTRDEWIHQKSLR